MLPTRIPRVRSRRSGARVLLACVALLGWSCSGKNPSSPGPPLPSTSAIEVASPPRGGMVQDGTLAVSPIAASGTACDSVSTVVSLSLDGQSVALSGTPPCLNFSTQLSSPWGLNIITGTARNEAGATATLAQSYLRSPDFSATTPVVQSVSDGLYMQVNQAVVDDGSRAQADDLTTLTALKLQSIDLNTMLPSVIVVTPDANQDGQVDSHVCNCVAPIPDITVHSTGYRVARGTLTIGGWSVDYIRLFNGDIQVQARSGAVSLPISVSGYLDPTCSIACVTRNLTNATVSGTLHANSITVDATLTATAAPDGTPQVTICPGCMTIDVSNPFLDIDWGALEFLDAPLGLSNMTTAILDNFTSKLETAAAALIQPATSDVVRSFFTSFEPPASVTLPPPMNTVLDLTSKFNVIAVEGTYPTGHIRIGLDVSVSPATPVVTSSLGSILRGGNVPTFSASVPGYGLGVGIKDDLLNQFLWAAWSGGALELSDISALGCSIPGGAAMSLSAMLPPVVMPGTNGHQIDIGIGDLYIEAGPPAGVARTAGASVATDTGLYASMVIGASVSIDPDTDKLKLTPAPNPEIDVQIVQAPEGADVVALASQYRTMLACTLPKLMTTMVGAFPAPSPPIGALDLPGVPPDARWGLSNGVVDRQDPYTTITGDVVVK